MLKDMALNLLFNTFLSADSYLGFELTSSYYSVSYWSVRKASRKEVHLLILNTRLYFRVENLK